MEKKENSIEINPQLGSVNITQVNNSGNIITIDGSLYSGYYTNNINLSVLNTTSTGLSTLNISNINSTSTGLGNSNITFGSINSSRFKIKEYPRFTFINDDTEEIIDIYSNGKINKYGNNNSK